MQLAAAGLTLLGVDRGWEPYRVWISHGRRDPEGQLTLVATASQTLHFSNSTSLDHQMLGSCAGSAPPPSESGHSHLDATLLQERIQVGASCRPCNSPKCAASCLYARVTPAAPPKRTAPDIAAQRPMRSIRQRNMCSKLLVCQGDPCTVRAAACRAGGGRAGSSPVSASPQAHPQQSPQR